MSDATLSVLARMAGDSRPATASSSDLGAFAAAVAKAVKTASASLLSSEIETSVAACSSAPLAEKLQTKPDPGVYYWVNDESGAPAALFAIEPAFAASMTERLLGGELTAPAAEAEPSILIFDMASALIDVAAPALSAIFAKLTDARSAPSLRGKRGARAKAQAMLDVEALPVCAVKLDFSYGEKEAKGAVEILFAQSFVDRLGLGGDAKPSAVAKNAGSDWSARLKRNVLACEIPLAVIIDSFATNIGELSRLSVGQTIDLDPEALSALDISAITDAGPVSVAKGRLGAMQSKKAVKLTTGIDPDFIRGL